MDLKLLTRETTYNGKKIQGAFTELENAVIALFWEGNEPQMGTLTVTLPDRSSSHLLGDRNKRLGLVIGAHIAAKTNKMALVSTNFPRSLGNKTGKVLFELVKKLINRER